MVFCHEINATVNGMINYIGFSPRNCQELDCGRLLAFRHSDAPWPREMKSISELTFGMALEGYVADGRFLFPGQVPDNLQECCGPVGATAVLCADRFLFRVGKLAGP